MTMNTLSVPTVAAISGVFSGKIIHFAVDSRVPAFRAFLVHSLPACVALQRCFVSTFYPCQEFHKIPSHGRAHG